MFKRTDIITAYATAITTSTGQFAQNLRLIIKEGYQYFLSEFVKMLTAEKKNNSWRVSAR